MRPFVIALLLFAVPASAAHRRQERAVRARLEQLVSTWATNDPQKLSALHTVHGDLIDPSGRRALGRMEIEKLYTDQHGSVMKGSRMALGGVEIRFLDDDLAVVDASARIEAMKGPAGELEPEAFHLLVVMREHGPRWMLVVTRWYRLSAPAR